MLVLNSTGVVGAQLARRQRGQDPESDFQASDPDRPVEFHHHPHPSRHRVRHLRQVRPRFFL